MKKVISLLIIFVLLFSLFAACGKSESKDNGSSTTGTGTGTKTPADADSVSTKTETVDLDKEEVKTHPSDDATLRFAINTDIGYLTQTGHGFSSNGTGSLFFGESLLRWNSDTNEVEPFIAESYEWVSDKVLRLHLRDDVTSISGDPFTASDVVFSWNWGHETAALGQYFNIFDYDTTKVVDTYTVDIGLLNAYPFLPLDLCHGAYMVACEKSIETLGGKEAAMLNPNACTGPYKMTKLDEVSMVCYAERRDDYWGLMPYYKNIEICSVTDANTRAMGIESGDYDFAMNPSTASVQAADGKTSKGWYIPAAGRFCNFTLNSDHEPLNIKEVRQAIALSINYQALLDISNSGNGILSDAATSSPLNKFSYTPVTDPDNCFLCRTDLELAKQKLTEAGYASGFTINCFYRPTDAQTASNAELLKNQLGQVGIILDLQPVDSANFNTITRSNDWDTHLSINGNPNPKRTLNPMDGTRQDHATAVGSAGSKWAPEGIEAIIDRCVQTVDDTERMNAFAEFNDIAREYVPQIILYCPYISFLSSADIVNVPVGSQGGPEVCRIFPSEYIEG